MKSTCSQVSTTGFVESSDDAGSQRRQLTTTLAHNDAGSLIRTRITYLIFCRALLSVPA